MATNYLDCKSNFGSRTFCITNDLLFCKHQILNKEIISLILHPILDFRSTFNCRSHLSTTMYQILHLVLDFRSTSCKRKIQLLNIGSIVLGSIVDLNMTNLKRSLLCILTYTKNWKIAKKVKQFIFIIDFLQTKISNGEFF